MRLVACADFDDAYQAVGAARKAQQQLTVATLVCFCCCLGLGLCLQCFHLRGKQLGALCLHLCAFTALTTWRYTVLGCVVCTGGAGTQYCSRNQPHPLTMHCKKM